jgi:tetratricopeptide (TPR) repeat protein
MGSGSESLSVHQGRVRRRRHRRLVVFALLAFVVASAERAAAGRYTDFTQEELRTLPRACLAQRFINDELDPRLVSEAEQTQWNERIGLSFIHYHHYCWALLFMRRAAGPGGERFDYELAVGNLDYVIPRADPNCGPFPNVHFESEYPIDNREYVIQRADLSCALLPDVYFQKGTALEYLGYREEAMGEYQNALLVQAGYTPARAALVQVYLDRGELEAARTALAEGLKYDPSSQTLADEQSTLMRRKSVTTDEHR